MKWTQEKLETLVRMWVADKPISEIAKKLGVKPADVRTKSYQLRSAGVPLPRRRSKNVDLKRLIDIAINGEEK